MAVKKKKAKRVSAKQKAINEAEKKLAQKWQSLKEKAEDVKAPAYDMKNEYEANTPIEHKQLGWGFILSNNNNRLEVLFEDGIKVLISNYK